MPVLRVATSNVFKSFSRASLYLISFTLVVAAIVDVADSQSLKAGGRNVCSKPINITRVVRVSVRQSYTERYYRPCRFRFWAKCTRFRTSFRTIYMNVNKPTAEKVPLCCEGWRQSGTECSTPICHNPCQNKGLCIGPDRCDCAPGWIGSSCQTACTDWMHGFDCQRRCACDRNTSVHCEKATGHCHCRPGYQGERCEMKCQLGYYGENCAQPCTCRSSGQCDHVTGKCNCTAGFYGPDCSLPCPQGVWGEHCVKPCQCENDAPCDAATGLCDCPPGWVGKRCNLQCPYGQYGPDCQRICECNQAPCDKVTGQCSCSPGFMGKSCEIPCPEGLFGRNCQFTCVCENGATCNPSNGKCTCPAGFIGERMAESA
ncbi:multiple epidermal growth factor-like domains protein 10 [Sycon ciliatum]|uniref:multiple epidermal growth factor-like domains protein 10 n=1 Tax=Sycon ciliatum TaxID=27933 RepID=UPI0031F64767